MKRHNITKTIFLIAMLALMQTVAFAQKAELIVETGHIEPVTSVAFSPDGKIFASGSHDNTVKLWDAQTRQELRTLAVHLSYVSSIAFSPDGKTLAAGSYKSIRFWDVMTGRELRTIEGRANSYNSVAFSPDGKILASGGSDKTIKLWDAVTGKELRAFTAHTRTVESVIFSPDGKTFASGSTDKTVKLWDVLTGQELRTLIGHTFDVNSIAFSLDGKTLASGCADKTIKLWDVQTGRDFRTLAGHNSYVSSVAFAPDGKTLVSGDYDNTVKVWDVVTWQEPRTLTGHTYGVYSFAFSPDGNTLAAGSFDKTVKLLNLITGQERTLKGHTSKVFSIAFSPDGKILASGSDDKTVKLWDMQTGQELRTLVGSSDCIFSIAFSPDGKTIAGGSFDGTIKIWDAINGRKLRSFIGHPYYLLSVAFSPDGKTIASGSSDKTVKLRDAITGKELRTFTGHTSDVRSVAFSPDGKMVASMSLDKTIRLWNVETGESRIFQTSIQKDISEVFFTVPDIYKKNENEPISPNGLFQIKPKENGKFSILEVNSGKLLASLIALGENDWAVVDPDGRFDASPGAQKLMHFVVGLELVDLEQIKDRYYTPNLLQRIFKSENLDATRKVSVFTADELYPLAEYAPLKANETVVDVKLKNRGGGIGRVQVFVNGAEFLADARPKGFDPKSQSAELKIDFSSAKTLKKGEPNSIKIIARNEAGWLRNRVSEIVYLDERKKDDAPPEFYAIIGGVSDYENDAFNLRYSAKDARDFAKAVELGAAKLFGKERVHIRLLASGSEDENAGLTGADSKMFAPTKENFRRTFEEFRKAKSTDVFVVYLAGHGTSINRGGDTGDTYLYLTQEAVTTDKSRLLDEKLRNATTVSSEELAEWIRDVPALKRTMILDTCAAGAVEASLTKARDFSPDQIKALDRMKDRTGFYVLMGSAADAQSYEATRYGQGLLTYSLLQGMSGARLRAGEYADINSLFNYAEDTVTEMAKGIGGIQQPRIIAPTESRSFDIGQFSPAEKSKFTLAKVKPLVLQPRLYNDKLKRDNLKISQAVAKILRDESSAASRSGGAETKLVFVEAEEINDAVTPSGVYEVSGDQIKVTLILVRNNEEIKTLTIEETAADLEELSQKIVKAIIENTIN